AGGSGSSSKTMQNWQRKGCGFSGAGLRATQKVAAGQRRRDRLRLNRRGGFISFRDKSTENRLGQTQFGKLHGDSFWRTMRTRRTAGRCRTKNQPVRYNWASDQESAANAGFMKSRGRQLSSGLYYIGTSAVVHEFGKSS